MGIRRVHHVSYEHYMQIRIPVANPRVVARENFRSPEYCPNNFYSIIPNFLEVESMAEIEGDTIVLGSSNRQTSLRNTEDLDDEIHKLLADAEVRLRARSAAGSNRERDGPPQFKYVQINGSGDNYSQLILFGLGFQRLSRASCHSHMSVQ